MLVPAKVTESLMRRPACIQPGGGGPVVGPLSSARGEARTDGTVGLTGPDLKNLQSRTFRLQVDTTRPEHRLGLV